MLSFDIEIRERMKAYAKRHGSDLSNLVIELCIKFLEENDGLEIAEIPEVELEPIEIDDVPKFIFKEEFDDYPYIGEKLESLICQLEQTPSLGTEQLYLQAARMSETASYQKFARGDDDWQFFKDRCVRRIAKCSGLDKPSIKREADRWNSLIQFAIRNPRARNEIANMEPTPRELVALPSNEPYDFKGIQFESVDALISSLNGESDLIVIMSDIYDRGDLQQVFVVYKGNDKPTICRIHFREIEIEEANLYCSEFFDRLSSLENVRFQKWCDNKEEFIEMLESEIDECAAYFVR